MSTSEAWFIEHFKTAGTCFGLAIDEKLHTEQSPYQSIEVYQTQTFGRLLVLDGCTMVSERDHFLYHEMMTHPAMAMFDPAVHCQPKNIAIIGGGDGGIVAELIKYAGVEQIVQIELDERVTEVSRQFFSALTQGLEDPRVQLRFEDGNQWVQSQSDASVDLLIVDSTDPVGPAEVLFSNAFLQQCVRVLTPNGILVQQSESPLLHGESLIQPMHESLKSFGMQTVKTLTFPQPIYPSGWWSATLSSNNNRLELREDLQLPETRYATPELLAAAFVLPKFLQHLNA